MNDEYTFTKLKDVGTGAGWKTYVINWKGGNANGTNIKSLVSHLKTQRKTINLEEGDFITCPGDTILRDGYIRKGASDKDLENFYQEGIKERIFIRRDR